MYIQLLLIQSLGIWERSVCPELQRGGCSQHLQGPQTPSWKSLYVHRKTVSPWRGWVSKVRRAGPTPLPKPGPYYSGRPRGGQGWGAWPTGDTLLNSAGSWVLLTNKLTREGKSKGKGSWKRPFPWEVWEHPSYTLGATRIKNPSSWAIRDGTLQGDLQTGRTCLVL